LTSPDSRSDGTPSREANLDADPSTPLTRRQLRELRETQQAAEAAEAAEIARVEAESAAKAAEVARAAEAARVAQVAEAAEIEKAEAASAAGAARAAEAANPSALAPAGSVPVVTAEIVLVKRAEPAPLTRRQLREREQLERERQRELQAEEIATLEVAEIGTAPLEPSVELELEPAEPQPSSDVLSLAPTDVPLHLARPRRESRGSGGQGRPVARFTPQARSLALEAQAHAGGEAGAHESERLALAPGPTPPRRRALTAGAGAGQARGPRVRRETRRSGWAKAALSGVAMAFVLGITAVTAIPATVSASPVDANVVNLSLNANATPATQQLITAGASSSEVVNRDGYGVTDAGELQAAGYSTAQLLVGRSLAQELVNALDSGKLVGSTPDHTKEIRWIAQGVTVPDCGVDYRILEIIAIAVRNFDQVGVSDINRKCTGQIEGGGTSSSHYIDGGGHAVDFYLLNNQSLNGADANTLRMISLLDPVMPVGSRVGQAGCRASAGVSVHLTNWTEFDDSCTHMHVDVPVTDAPLLLTDDSPLAK
jgi:hypothetical protein